MRKYRITCVLGRIMVFLKRNFKNRLDKSTKRWYDNKAVWLVGQAVKTPPSHGGNMGSIPIRVTRKIPETSSFRDFCFLGYTFGYGESKLI
jgi:hypothetical protein